MTTPLHTVLSTLLDICATADVAPRHIKASRSAFGVDDLTLHLSTCSDYTAICLALGTDDGQPRHLGSGARAYEAQTVDGVLLTHTCFPHMTCWTPPTDVHGCPHASTRRAAP